MEHCFQGLSVSEQTSIQAGQQNIDSSDNLQTYFGRLTHMYNQQNKEI